MTRFCLQKSPAKILLVLWKSYVYTALFAEKIYICIYVYTYIYIYIHIYSLHD